MIRPIITALVFFAVIGVESTQAQQPVTFKNFAAFRQVVPDVDFYASNRQIVAPYEKPVAETVARLKGLFGPNIPRGAIFICSNLEQKDSIYEPMVLKKGYSWTLTVVTSEVRMQEMMARMKAQMGGSIPAELLSRMNNRPPEMSAEMEKQALTSMAQQVAYAVIQTTFAKDLKYRSSRIDDMGKSPLPDWLDIGIASYVSGSQSNLSYLQQHMDQTFSIEDVVSISRPFVASNDQNAGGGRNGGGMMRMGNGNGAPGGSMFGQGMPPGGMQGMPPMPGGGQGMPQGGFGGRSMGGAGNFGGNGNQRGGFQRVIAKDEQDRMLFDAQASTLFSYLMEKAGTEKVKQMIKHVQEGKESRDFLAQPDVLGSDFTKIEEDWAGYVKALKPQQQMRGPGFPGQF